MKQLYFYVVFMLFMMIMMILTVLISVAFLTLMERKMLGYIQDRKGPNKLGFTGLVQPFSDAIKLLSKEYIYMNKMNFIMYVLSPLFMLILLLMMWMIYPFWLSHMNFNMLFVYLMCCLSLSAYGLMISGWSSNSFYSMLGSIRSLAQSISYEVSLSLIMIIPLIYINSYNLNNLSIIQDFGFWLIIINWPLSLLFFFSIMAELNRSPFDFSEGESELVSGFNIEYGGVGFTMIFLSEYLSILFLSYLFSLFYLGGNYNEFMFFIKILLLTLMIIWIRGTMPRFRYDLLMYLCWLIILPLSINNMIYVMMLKIMI